MQHINNAPISACSLLWISQVDVEWGNENLDNWWVFPGELIKEESVLTGTKSSVEIEHNNKDCGKSNQGDRLSSDNL